MNIKIENLYNLNETIAKDIFEEIEYPWEVIPKIKDFIINLGNSLSEEHFDKIGEDVWIAKSANIAPTACIIGPTIIDENSEVRHCAYIRGNAIIGKNVVVGNSTELKNCILFNNVQVPHYNYIGDSILGYRVHMGAGSITSNIKSDKTNVVIKLQKQNNLEKFETGLIKCGAMIGDCVEIGCGTVLNPGTIIGKNSQIYPLSCVRGVISENVIYKRQGEVFFKK